MKSSQNPDSRAAEAASDISPGLILKHVPGTFGICRLGSRDRIPRWVHRSIFFSICRSPDELSLLCEDRLVPDSVRCERGWSAIRVLGTLDLSLVGVLASLAQPLADAGIGLFTVSTYDTDYLLVREKRLDDAVAVLEAAGHSFRQETSDAKAAESQGEPGKTAQRSTAAPRRQAEPPAAPEPAAPKPAAPEPTVPEATAPAHGEPEPGPPREPAADPVPKPQKPARKSAFARVLSEFGLGPKEPEPATEQDAAAWAPPTRRSRAVVVEQAKFAAPPARKPEQQAAPAKPWRQEEAETTPPATVAPAEVAPAEVAPAEVAPAEVAPAEVAPAEVAPAEVAPAKVDNDAGARAEGLFTGAIPQQSVEITDKSFEELGLSRPILETVREVGFEHPTPIQAKVIPVAEEGFDVIGLAETGSGKTAAFCLPLAEKLTHGRGTRGLILCPTREIALQTKAFLDIFGRDHELETVAVIGGVRMGPQIDGFRRDADILVATPGRLADHLRRRNVSLDKLEELVLDEADHMLDLGFLPQIKEILEHVPVNRRTLMFSATMPPPIERLAQVFMNNPVRCDIRPEGQLAAGIEHRLYLVSEEDRKDCLFALLREVEGSTLIFIRRKLYTEWLARQLKLSGFPVARIHSDRSQAQRVQALRAFREGKVRILVATDVAARGIDVPLIQHVINYGPPEQVGDYVHRGGRTARGSAGGIVSTIGTWQDKLMVRDIELDLGITMPRCTVAGVEPYKELPKRKMVRRRRLL